MNSSLLYSHFLLFERRTRKFWKIHTICRTRRKGPFFFLFLTITSLTPSPVNADTMKTLVKPGQPATFSMTLAFSFEDDFLTLNPLGSNVFSVNLLVISNKTRFDRSMSILFRTRKLGSFGYAANVSKTVACNSFRVHEFDASWTTPIISEC